MSIMMHRRGVIAASIMKIGATQPPVGEDGTGITSWDWNDGKLATYQSVLHSTATAPVVEFPNGGVRLKLTDNGDARIRLNPTLKLKDFDISFKMHIPSEAGAYVGIVYRTAIWLNSDSHHAYSLYMGPSGAYLAKGSNNADTVNWELVTSNATVLSPNSECIVRLEVVGDKHTLYLNGNKWMTGTDAAFPDAGEIGLRFYATTANTGALVDDVSITSLDFSLVEDPHWFNVFFQVQPEGSDPTLADLHDERGNPLAHSKSTVPQYVSDAAVGSASLAFAEGDWVRIETTNAAIGTQDFTLEGWFKIPAAHVQTGFNNALLSFNTPQIRVTSRPDGHIQFQQTGNSPVVGADDVLFTPDVWHKVVLQRASGIVSVWLDAKVAIDNIPDTHAYAPGLTYFASSYNYSSDRSLFGYSDGATLTVGVARYSASNPPSPNVHYIPPKLTTNDLSDRRDTLAYYQLTSESQYGVMRGFGSLAGQAHGTFEAEPLSPLGSMLTLPSGGFCNISIPSMALGLSTEVGAYYTAECDFLMHTVNSNRAIMTIAGIEVYVKEGALMVYIGANQDLGGTHPVAPDVLHRVAIEFDRTKFRLWLDGALLHSGAFASGSPTIAKTTVNLGSYNGNTEWLDGKIGRFRLSRGDQFYDVGPTTP